jgi:extradiol dioxygenase family protein
LVGIQINAGNAGGQIQLVRQFGQQRGRVKFGIEPYIRFKGQVGEQGTMFFYDPSGNALEFKAFKDISLLFAK